MHTNLPKISEIIENAENDFDQLHRAAQPDHRDILSHLLKQIGKVDFHELAGIEEDENLSKKHFQICCIEEILRIAKHNNWGMCIYQGFVYVYNGCFWSRIENAELQTFLGEAAERMGIKKFDARHYLFRDQLEKQFMAVANLSKPEHSGEKILVNLKNGTHEITPSQQSLREHRQEDFMTYQLPFAYNPEAKAPIFQAYFDKVLPDREIQSIVAEYVGYLFIKPCTLKLEKTLLLYGTGANGKSVFFEIINALLGKENVSSYSLQSLTNNNGYHRAMLSNKLVNYASEINGKLETSIFKQLVSGEPVEARLPYGEPFIMSNYAKLIFNCNELPKDVEQSNAFFRRFLIVPFAVTIAEADQDKQLSRKIIDNELAGIFNWVLSGLRRLLEQKRFTESQVVNDQLQYYKKSSDSVQMFLEDEGFEKSTNETREFKELFALYRTYCSESGYHPCAKKTVGDRLRNLGFKMERKNYGMVVFVKKVSF